jgi:hypothetical protein
MHAEASTASQQRSANFNPTIMRGRCSKKSLQDECGFLVLKVHEAHFFEKFERHYTLDAQK